MTNFTFTLNQTTSYYLQLYQFIKQKIDEGHLQSDEKLPSKRELATHLGLSINTVMNAYHLLLDEGYIYSKEKKGYFVSKQDLITTHQTHITIKQPKEKFFYYDLTTRNSSSLPHPYNQFQKCYKEVLQNRQYLLESPIEGMESLRNAISRHLLENRGIKVDAKQILIGTGLEMLEKLFPLLVFDSLAIENPGYHKLASLLKYTKCQIEYLPLDEDGVTIPKHSQLLYTTPFNQFPTGIKMSISRKKELIKWAQKNHSFIIEDDFDAEFRISGAPTTALYSLSPDHVIFFSTFSTTLFTGLKIAYMILPKNLYDSYVHYYEDYTNPVSTIQQCVLTQFIESGCYARHLNHLKKSFILKRQIIIDALKDLKCITLDTQKNYLTMLIELNEDIPLEKFLLDLSYNKIKMNRLSDYDIEHKSLRTFMIGYTNLSEDELKDALNCLKNCLLRYE